MRINRNLQRNMKLLSSIKAEVRKEFEAMLTSAFTIRSTGAEQTQQENSVRATLSNFFNTALDTVAEATKDAIVPPEAGHGNYHCGIEECCGKNTAKRKLSATLSDAECRGRNDCRTKTLQNYQEFTKNHS